MLTVPAAAACYGTLLQIMSNACAHAITHICIKDVMLDALTATTAVVLTFTKNPHSASIRQISDQQFRRQVCQLLEE